MVPLMIGTNFGNISNDNTAPTDNETKYDLTMNLVDAESNIPAMR